MNNATGALMLLLKCATDNERKTIPFPASQQQHKTSPVVSTIYQCIYIAVKKVEGGGSLQRKKRRTNERSRVEFQGQAVNMLATKAETFTRLGSGQ